MLSPPLTEVIVATSRIFGPLSFALLLGVASMAPRLYGLDARRERQPTEVGDGISRQEGGPELKRLPQRPRWRRGRGTGPAQGGEWSPVARPLGEEEGRDQDVVDCGDSEEACGLARVRQRYRSNRRNGAHRASARKQDAAKRKSGVGSVTGVIC
jgi:hypothetical protein